MKKIFLYIGMLFCFSFLLCACSNEQEQEVSNIGDTEVNEETSEQAKLNVIRPSAYSNVNGLTLEPGSSISIIGRYADDSFWSEVEAGAVQAISDINAALGYKGEQKIELSYCAPDIRDDVNEQINILDEELSRYPVAVGIAAIDMSACALQFELAAENNISIVTFDSGSEYAHVASHISTDNLKAASTAATKLAHAINETGEVAILVQDSTSTTAMDRLNGFQDEITKDYPDISIVSVYHMDELSTMADAIAEEKNLALAEDEEPIDPSSISQKEVVQYILEQHPNLKGIYTTNLDTTQLVSKVITDSQRTDLKIVGFDGGGEQLSLLEDGIVEGLLIQNPYGIGYATVIAAARASLGLANESIVDTGYTWVTKDNMTETSIANMLY